MAHVVDCCFVIVDGGGGGNGGGSGGACLFVEEAWAYGTMSLILKLRLACGGAVKLLHYALTWSLIQDGGDLSPRGEQGFAR